MLDLTETHYTPVIMLLTLKCVSGISFESKSIVCIFRRIIHLLSIYYSNEMPLRLAGRDILIEIYLANTRTCLSTTACLRKALS